MPNIKNILTKCIFVAVSLCFVFTIAYGAELTTEDKLNKGKSLYEEGKYDDAMDNFIEVFVHGNADQISQANEYVNMIHFKRGGVEAPKQVPYDEKLEKSRETGHEGKVLFDSRKNKEATLVEPSKGAKTPASAVAGPSAYATQQGVIAEPTIYTPEGAISEENRPIEKIVSHNSMPSESDAEVKALRRDSINAQVASMVAKVLEKLNTHKGVSVYMRGGMVDAIDIDSEVIFLDDGVTFRPESKEILDQIYSLMILSGTPSFVLLPPGSYSDDVSIQAVRQTVALNSYLINMGVSTAKLSFNMGLTTEQPPAKFSDLDGISIVFDYTAKPTLKLKSPERNIPPVLSLGMYPFRTITPDMDEGMVVDFSIVQSYAKVADWTLQIIQHAKDGKYYVVRQISGDGATYRQIFWNGKKQYFGQILPLGNYTIILKAQDVDGREKIVRRKVELLGSKKEEFKPAKTATRAVAEPKLDYAKKRLWTKPEATRMAGAAAVSESIPAVDDFMMEQPASLPADDFGMGDMGNDYNNLMPSTPTAGAGFDAGQYNNVNTPSMPYDNAGAVPDAAANYDY